MKICLIFADMLRSNLLNLYDLKNKKTDFDETLRKWGGVYYKNSFTPAPDTPRSSACLWTSRFPKFNKCNTRVKYPYYYLKDDNNFLALLKENNFSLNFYIEKSTKKLGLIPKGFDDYALFSDGMILSDYLEKIDFNNEKSLTFIYLPDYHHTVDEYHAAKKSHFTGLKYLNGALEVIDEKIGIDNFDLFIMFSDHGFKLNTEIETNYKKKILKQLGRDRTQIFLYTRLKNQSSFNTSDRLVSILDIGKTILDFCKIKIPYPVDGISLLSNDEHDNIVIEDHKDFGISLSQSIEYYGLRSKNNLIVTDCHKNVFSEKTLTEIEKNDFFNILSNAASHYLENIKQQMLLDYYKEEVKDNIAFYNGDTIKKHFSLVFMIKKIVKKLYIFFCK